MSTTLDPESPSASMVLGENGLVVDPSTDGDWSYDPNEPRYCVCNQVSYGDMVACDNEAVSILYLLAVGIFGTYPYRMSINFSFLFFFFSNSIICSVHLNGFIILVLESHSHQRVNGIVRNVRLRWKEEECVNECVVFNISVYIEFLARANARFYVPTIFILVVCDWMSVMCVHVPR